MTARTTERIRGEGGKKGESPASEGTKKSVFGRVDSRDKASVLNSRRKSDGGMIEAIVANHFEMLVGDMDNEALTPTRKAPPSTTTTPFCSRRSTSTTISSNLRAS